MGTSSQQPDLAAQQARLFAASRFARTTCQRDPALLDELLASGDLSRAYTDSEMSETLAGALAACADADALARGLRLFRRREMLRILWRDFNRLADTLETTRDTSLLAEACVQQALHWWYRDLAQRHGEPRDSLGRPQQLVVLAMGKLGARELNVSSDIDLIFCYPESGNTAGTERPLSNQEFFTRLGQRLIAALDQVTVDGFVFRVDMRLRPYGESGPLVVNFASMEAYYEEQGRDWERYALIKARPITGDAARAADLMRCLVPFVYRRYIDFGVIDSLRAMKQMIRAEVNRRGLENDVKLGPGGIREVEFIVQCFQLIRGGRSSALRRTELLPVLHALQVEGCLPASAVRELREAYLFLRDVEHAIQGYEDRQTQSLPSEPAPREALLAAMGFADWTGFELRLNAYRKTVSNHFEALIAPREEPEPEAEEQLIWPDAIEAEALASMGFDSSEALAAALLALRDSPRVRQLQAAGRERLDQFMPKLLSACAGVDGGATALERLLPLVQAVVRRSAYLALLLENPRALDELVLLCAASPWISAEIARNPVLLDELLDASDLYSAPDRQALADELGQQLTRLAPDDLEASMDALRYFKASQQLRVAASEVTGRLPLMQVSDKLTFLAEVILEQALAMGWQDMARRHGYPSRGESGSAGQVGASGLADCGFVIIGYGKLGGIELGHGSDLDLVFIYDDDIRGATGGERALDAPVFYTRLGQRIIHILDTRTAMGPLYDVDMRLRPQGNSGMLVAGFRGFAEYQKQSAWTWEHQALVRARVIAGDTALARRCNELRQSVLVQSRDQQTLAEEVSAMREKMRTHLLSARAEAGGRFHLKQGVGGIVDIEFMVQYAVLAWSHKHPRLAHWTDNIRILETLSSEGL
ncbi:MAG: bifunctional [glutamate--ammonia ligase]-adenylyl-L-tyrosine phosphorylase/[glutamate--ammonia-ligase] adenylyltransferase, partial [Halieaceae bacterium]|nr:bifunctional [glutamate--ammonia ligase]-adenylyl-L-tyrosine phosphorylase/[glutamate--ammonia-ligase] adenylyltransferase [Halieaceae bacterium]